MRAWKMTDAQFAEARRLYETGEVSGVVELGARYSVNFATLARRLKKAGVQMRPRGRAKGSTGKRDEKRAESVRRVREGETITAVARSLGIGRGVLWRWCRDDGVPRRVKPPREKRVRPPRVRVPRPARPPARRSDIIDLTGKTFGAWTVVRIAPRGGRSRRSTQWWCRCACGTERSVNGQALRSGGTRSCGCIRSDHIRETYTAKRDDLTGQTFGALTVLGYAPSYLWRCRCPKGHETQVARCALTLQSQCRTCRAELTAAKNARVRDLYARGMSLKEIGAEVGEDFTTVHKRLVQMGVSRRRKGAPKGSHALPVSTVDEIVRRAREGERYVAIAASLGIHNATVWRYVQRADQERDARMLVMLHDGASPDAVAELFEVSTYYVQGLTRKERAA